MSTRRIMVASSLGAAVVVAWLVWLRPAGPPAETPSADDPAERRKREPIGAAVGQSVDVVWDGLIGSRACAECHAEIAGDYQHSGMSHSWQPIDAALVQALGPPNSVADPNSDYRYRVHVEEGKAFQEETLAGGSKEHVLRVQACYLVGSGKHAQTMVAETNGFLTQLPLAWFSQEGQWRLNPGYELRNPRFSRPIPPGCVFCHATLAAHVAPTPNRYRRPVEAGIGCERCHGPGRGHVMAHSGALPHGTPGGGSAEIVNPAKLDPQRANDVCLQCHLQGDVSIHQPGAHAFSFQPGERLQDHRLDFLVQTEAPEAFGVASHGARMLRSPCYVESGGGLTCILCHDPHKPVEAFSPSFYDAKCLQCHAPEACRRDRSLAERHGTRHCASCHMPQRETREGQHLVFTDHWIQRPAPEGERQPPAPVELKRNADVELLSFWPEADPDQVRLGSAYVDLHLTMGPQFPALERGIALLEAALKRNPSDPQARYWLASADIPRRRSDRATSLLRGLLEERPDWHEARYRLAIAYDQLQDYPAAIAEYERVIRAVPDWMEPYSPVIRLHLFRRDPQAAIRLARQQLSYGEDAAAYVNLAMARDLEGASMAECLAIIEAALHLNPRLVDAYINRAWLLARAGKRDQARQDYETVLQIEPRNATAAAALKALGGRTP